MLFNWVLMLSSVGRRSYSFLYNGIRIYSRWSNIGVKLRQLIEDTSLSAITKIDQFLDGLKLSSVGRRSYSFFYNETIKLMLSKSRSYSFFSKEIRIDSRWSDIEAKFRLLIEDAILSAIIKPQQFLDGRSLMLIIVTILSAITKSEQILDGLKMGSNDIEC